VFNTISPAMVHTISFEAAFAARIGEHSPLPVTVVGVVYLKAASTVLSFRTIVAILLAWARSAYRAIFCITFACT